MHSGAMVHTQGGRRHGLRIQDLGRERDLETPLDFTVRHRAMRRYLE